MSSSMTVADSGADADRPGGAPADPFVPPIGTGPIRAELLGTDRLEAHARQLAAACRLAPPTRASSPLLRRSAENGRALIRAHRRILDEFGVAEGRSLDVEWLVDNFHIVDENLREVRQDLPGGYDVELPKLADGPLRGYPRVHAIAMSLVAHTDGELEEARIGRFLDQFQEVAPLTIGELWAVPTMLRLVLLENLRRLADQMLAGWDERHEAERWADRLTHASEGPASAEGPPLLSDPFVVRLLDLLRDRGPAGSAALASLEGRLTSVGVEQEGVVRREQRRQAANQVSVGNSVISLRLLSAIDWNAFFERTSLVEAALREDPSGAYPRQDFATRDRSRQALERIARGSGVEEVDLARRVVGLARAGAADGPARGHVGYYLIDRGQIALKRGLGFRPTARERLIDLTLGHPRLVYFGSIAGLIAALVAIAIGAGLSGAGWVAGWEIALIALVLLLPASELAVGLVNQLLTLWLQPRVLAKLDFRTGIADDCPTFVVMPTMLARLESAGVLLERLEIHSLANPDPNLRFALLTDFADADSEHAPEDAAYLQAAMEGVRALNDRYCAGGPDRYFVFHRRRQWNLVEGKWMGWERKRGKLSEFNRLLRGDESTSYSALSGDPTAGPRTRYVITLDSDTQLTRDSASRMVGTLAHPLNQAKFDPSRGRVVEGYGVLQPRVSYHLLAATRSRFAGVHAASAGIDPYATAISDTYMDLFGTGSFTGKGIYDVDAFEAATGHTFPENRILSHDLIEGNYARCGLATDVELFDDFPPRYHAYARREHRWARGDWQLLPWIGPMVPTPEGPRRNPLPALERWKLFDNLRRSLVPPGLVVLLVLGWTALPGSPWAWTLAALAVPALPLAQLALGTTIGAVRSRTLGGFKGWVDSLPATLGQVGLSIAFLADQAIHLADAIVRTLVRLFVTRRKMLEWETAAATERRLGVGVGQFYATMWPAVALSLAIGALVLAVQPSALPAAGAVLLAWSVSPLVAHWVSQSRPTGDAPLTDEERRALRRVARRTWLFFESFVGAGDHWLPPDNYQEDPGNKVAHRTSPTNKGLLLLSTLAAHDLGYIGPKALVDRLGRTFDTLERLEKFRGHIYNWYNTRTLAPLLPIYISTVDSGNLLGCLVGLRQGLREVLVDPWPGPSLREGLLDTLGVVAEAARGIGPAPDGGGSGMAEASRDLEAGLRAVGRSLEESPADLVEWDDWLGRLDWAVVGLIGGVRAVLDRGGQDASGLERWSRKLADQVRDANAELALLAPWASPLRDLDQAIYHSGEGPGTELAREGWPALRAAIVRPSSVVDLADRGAKLVPEVDALEAICPACPSREAIVAGLRAVSEALGKSAAATIRDGLLDLAGRAGALGDGMDFGFLFRPDRHLFAIGYNLTQGRLDAACYDLLASESALTSYLTVARGEAPRRHWFQLGRPYIRAAGRIGLMSWGGTMFEFLMPRLLLRALPGTLLAEACRTAVARQIEYGRQAGVPWGISESSFAELNADHDYDYQAFGVPGLGIKRGLERDLVIAPYATALAAAVRPREALENFRRLVAEGAEGPFGFYEAIDFTADRLPRGRRSAVVRSYMAHHQGMSLVALANAVLGDVMPRRFHAEMPVRSSELLLQERVPRDPVFVTPSEVAPPAPAAVKERTAVVPLLSRRLNTPDTPVPRTLLLSNARYSVLLTNAGAGSSTFRGIDVTRWREDRTRDAWGQFCYVRDLGRNLVWSAGYQPTVRPADEYHAIFAADKATIHRLDHEIETTLEVTVSPEDPAEVRRITLTNKGDAPRELELTSYAEVVLGARGGDRMHPAFGKLFLETEWLAGPQALLCRRRPRSSDQKPIWAVHVSAIDASQGLAPVQYETDRTRFLGRGRTVAEPAALDPGANLSATIGPVLDPILSLRRRVRLGPGESASVAFMTAVAETRAEAEGLADQYREPGPAARAFEMAWAHAQVEHRHKHWSPEEAHLFQRLAGRIIYADPSLRADPSVMAANRLGQEGLWGLGISGDRPIVLVRLADLTNLSLARQSVLAHSFLRHKGLEFDLVLLDDQPDDAGETQGDDLLGPLKELARAGTADLVDKPGGLFVRRARDMDDASRTLLAAIAQVVLDGARGPLATQLESTERPDTLPGPFQPDESPAAVVHEVGPVASDASSFPDGLFPNGFGSFRPDGREYQVVVRGEAGPNPLRNGVLGEGPSRVDIPPGRPILPPAPWINVVANPAAGFLVSEAGSGYTWAGNSQANRLTPWNNDPVADEPGEAVYLRDEQTGAIWSPTPLPIPSPEPTLVRHGQGYSTFERQVQGLEHELTLFVPPDDPIKILHLKIRNPGRQARRVSATFYAEWVLGLARETSAPQVVTEVDESTGALLARNAYRADFAGRVAFADVDRRPRTLTADRREFLGRNGSVAAPAALRRDGLSGRAGAGLDPCAAIQTTFDLGPGEEHEVRFLLGEGESLDHVRRLLARYRDPEAASLAFDEARRRWDETLEAVRVRTPNPALDLLVNRWLVYQVLACRVWGRSAFYQSGGAFGYRDQLQDSMALVYGAPAEARAHILRAAGRQFVEGDVQHWWHPPAGRGVRTRFSDDYLWLPLVAHHYVTTTGDAAILDESAPYLEGRPLEPGQEDDYGLPTVSDQSATLYDHCVKALDRGLGLLGRHGLPLMGTGDWNDGMNKVGAEGKGESVWDAWFLATILRRFAELSESRGDQGRADRFREGAESLRRSVEEHAWDGGWYLRAFFDDGTPLGSKDNDECQIDSIAQTWAVLSGLGDLERARRAMAAVDEQLVRDEDGLILLFTPPFDRGKLQPGYVKGYVPGIRENGGQYTHAATWVVEATAQLGRGGRAVELFDLLNPIRHAETPEGVERYKVEPYVVAADVYGRPPHTGRGGWTWYTGSAAWMFRVALESILGFHLLGDRLAIDPRIPADWPGFEVRYRHRSATYTIAVENPDGVERGVARVVVDDQDRPDKLVELIDDGRPHRVRVVMGPTGGA